MDITYIGNEIEQLHRQKSLLKLLFVRNQKKENNFVVKRTCKHFFFTLLFNNIIQS